MVLASVELLKTFPLPVLLWKPRERTGCHVWTGSCESLERGRVWAEVDNLFSGWKGVMGRDVCVWCDVHVCLDVNVCVKLFKNTDHPQTPEIWFIYRPSNDLFPMLSCIWPAKHQSTSASKPSCIQDKIIKKVPNLLDSSFLKALPRSRRAQPINVTFEKDGSGWQF